MLRQIRKAGTPEDKAFLHQRIAEVQENVDRLLHFVEGLDITKFAEPGETQEERESGGDKKK